jgi:Tol biopolymer transport system component
MKTPKISMWIIFLFYLPLFIISCSKENSGPGQNELEKNEKSKEVIASLEGRIIFVNNSLQIEKLETKPLNVKTVISQQNVNTVGPKWSPDGTKVAYVKLKGDPGQTLAWYLSTVTSDGIEQTELLLGPSDQMEIIAISWAPDGKNIAILTSSNKILYIDLNTHELTETSLLSDSENYKSMAWRPVGNKIAVSSVSGNLGAIISSIWLIQPYEKFLVKNQDNLLLTTNTDIEYMNWSKDGKMLAYSEKGYSGSIYIINSDGTGNRKLILHDLYKDEKVNGCAPCWSSNNEQIIYAGVTSVSGSTLIPGLFVTDISGSYKVDIKVAGVLPDWY